jgi:hypothetical protein
MLKRQPHNLFNRHSHGSSAYLTHIGRNSCSGLAWASTARLLRSRPVLVGPCKGPSGSRPVVAGSSKGPSGSRPVVAEPCKGPSGRSRVRLLDDGRSYRRSGKLTGILPLGSPARLVTRRLLAGQSWSRIEPVAIV